MNLIDPDGKRFTLVWWWYYDEGETVWYEGWDFIRYPNDPPPIPNDGDPLPSSGGPSQKQILLAAASDVKALLTADSPCAAFFGGKNAVEALDDLISSAKIDKLDNHNIGIQMGGAITQVTNASTGFVYETFANVTVNSMGTFFNTWDITSSSGPKALPNVGDYTAGSSQARAVELLYELGHMVLTQGPRGNLIPLLPFESDRNQASESEANTQTVMDKCKTQIDAFYK